MEIDDVTYIAQQMKDAEKLTFDEQEKLRSLEIKLRGPVLPQHEIESRAGTHVPSSEEMQRIQALTSIRRGCYKPTEDKKIIRNWKAFCQLHDWDEKKVQPFLLIRDNNKTHIRSKKQRRKFAQFLADGLPHRTLYSVYHRFRTLYEDHNQKRYSPAEDSMILDHLERNPYLDEKRKYSDLAKVLKRSRGSIWRHYRLLKERRKKAEHT